MADPTEPPLDEGVIRSLRLLNGEHDKFDWDALYSKAGKKYGVDPLLLKSIYQTESGEGKDNYNPSSGASGPGQFMPETAKQMGLRWIYDPEASVDASARYLAEGMKHVGGDPAKLASTYYGGYDPKKWGDKTGQYAQTVMRRYEQLQELAQTASAEAKPQAQPGEPELDPKVVDYLKSLQPGQETPGAAPDMTAKPEPGQQQVPVHQGKPVEWGPLQETQNSLLFGAGPMVRAAGQTVQDYLSGEGEGGIGERYSKNRNEVDAARAAYVKEHPTQSMLIDLAGGTATSALALARAGQGVAAGVNLLEQGAPRVAALVKPAVEFLAGAAGKGAPGVVAAGTRMASRAAAGAIQGGLTAAMTSDFNPEDDRGTQTARGAEIGAGISVLAGPFAPLVQKLFGGAVDKGMAQFGQMARNMGIDIRPGQLTGSDFAKALDTWATKGDLDDTQLKQFTRAVSRTFGEDTDDVSGGVVQRAWRRLDAEKDRVENLMSLTADPQFHQEAADIGRRLSLSGLEPPAMRRVNKAMDAITDYLRIYNGQIPGKVFSDLTRKGGMLDLMMNSNDVGVQHFGAELRNLLQRGMQRTSPANVVQEWSDVMAQRKALAVLKPEIDAAQARGGVLDPKAVARIIRNEYNVATPGPGPGGVNVLAAVGPKLPSITPGPRPAGIRKVIETFKEHPLIGGAAGAGAGHFLSEPNLLIGAAAAGGGAALGRAALRRLYTSPKFADAALEAARQGKSYWQYLGLPNPLITAAVTKDNLPKGERQVTPWYLSPVSGNMLQGK